MQPFPLVTPGLTTFQTVSGRQVDSPHAIVTGTCTPTESANQTPRFSRIAGVFYAVSSLYQIKDLVCLEACGFFLTWIFLNLSRTSIVLQNF